MKKKLLQLQTAKTLKRLWPFINPARRLLLLAALITLALTMVEIASPILVGTFVDSLLGVSPGGTAFWLVKKIGRGGILIILGVSALLRGLLLICQQSQGGKIGEQVAMRLRTALWAHVQRLPLDYTRQRGSGRLLIRLVGDTRSVQRLVTFGLVRLTQDLLLCLAVLAVLALVNWRMALAVTLVLPVYGAIFYRQNPKLREASRAARRQRSKLSAYLDERIIGMAALKACVRQAAESERGQRLSKKLADRGVALVGIGGRLQGLAASTVALCSVLVLALSAGEMGANRLSAGSLVAFYTFLGLLLPIFQRIAVANRYFQEAHISVERIASTLARESENSDDEQRPALMVNEGVISVESVSYQYGENSPALCEVNLVARRGELIALVGPNGAGKSTLLELLLRFRQPTSGSIKIDGQDIAEVSLDSLRSQIGLMPQEALLFNGTIAENIRYSIHDETQDWLVTRAAHLAGVNRFAASLPEGLATRVGIGGRSLSGGQRQRVAFARALAHDPPILVLDEATSALDAETEQMFSTTLRKLAREKTVIVSAHRLTTLLVADRIYVLEQGRIIETGTHHSLLRSGKVYARLFGDLSERICQPKAAA